MTPTEYGYRRCVRCGCWRPLAATKEVEWVCLPGDQVAQGHQCSDDAACSRLADVGQGLFDGDRGGP